VIGRYVCIYVGRTVVTGSACVVEKRWHLRTVGGQIDNICSPKHHIILILLTNLRSHSIHIRNPLVMSMGMSVSMAMMMVPPRRSHSRRSRHWPIQVRLRRRYRNSTCRRCCRYRCRWRPWRYNIRRNLHWSNRLRRPTSSHGSSHRRRIRRGPHCHRTRNCFRPSPTRLWGLSSRRLHMERQIINVRRGPASNADTDVDCAPYWVSPVISSSLLKPKPPEHGVA